MAREFKLEKDNQEWLGGFYPSLRIHVNYMDITLKGSRMGCGLMDIKGLYDFYNNFRTETETLADFFHATVWPYLRELRVGAVIHIAGGNANDDNYKTFYESLGFVPVRTYHNWYDGATHMQTLYIKEIL